ncbi:MAG: DNA polymerase III subunit alpha [Gammaproteobacteria bacterium]
MRLSETFIPLHVHSEYSIMDSLIRLKTLCARCVELQIPAIALTDVCNLFALVKFYSTAVQYGLKPIIGAELWYQVENGPQCQAVVLCQNEAGYRNLIALISKAFQLAPRAEVPIIPLSWILEHQAGLLILLGQKSDLGCHVISEENAKVEQSLNLWHQTFQDRLYLSVQRLSQPHETVFNESIRHIAIKHQIPLVATHPIVFLDEDDYTAHEARVCIQSGSILADEKRPKRYTQAQYLKSPAEMNRLFQDMPGAVLNTVEIAKRCNVEIKLDNVYLPNFPVPQGQTIDEFFAEKAKIGLDKRLEQIFPERAEPDLRKPYDERLASELKVINRMGYAGYFLIVADFIQWAKDHHIPVGPGRGSGAGSLIAYSLNITDLDPLAYELLFERFLNPERVSMPDFDVDFCMDNRDRVIDYVSQRYGRESVSQIATFGTMAAKAVVRDVGRVLNHPYGFVDKIAKLIPFELGITLEKALTQEALLKQRYDTEEEVKELIDLAKKLEGLVRNVGKHAGGVVIAPSKLIDFVPLYCEPGSDHVVTQFDKDDVEKMGLVKFDFLGLKTLTIVDWAVQAINEFRKKSDLESICIDRIPLDDPKTFELLKACKTTAVFQLESRGMKDLISRLLPDELEEIIALVALFRPGPLQSGMVDDFINRKHGRAPIEYPHPDLEPILKPTYGVILYQEQVMQIAQKLAGYTLGGADLLRRAMGKKKPEEMRKQREIFTKGSVARGVEEAIATHIFDLMEKFAGYGFNKSHSAAYALLSYQTAWLKTHYADFFMAAVLSADMAHTDKVVMMIEDCAQLGITILPPDINQSSWKFTVQSAAHLRYGLGAIKGVGEAAIESILIQRQANGPFKDLHDFINRIDGRKINKRVLEALVRSGALDDFGLDRAHLLASLEGALQHAEQHSKQRSQGQFDLFGEEIDKPDIQAKLDNVPKLTLLEKLKGEKETLGYYLSGHPMTPYAHEFKNMDISSIRKLGVSDSVVKTAGFINQVRFLQTKRGDRMAVLTIEDGQSKIDVTVFSDILSDVRDIIYKDNLIVVEGTVSVDNFTQGLRLTAKSVLSMASARGRFAKHLKICLPESKQPTESLNEIKSLLQSFKHGSFPIVCQMKHGQAHVYLRFGRDWRCSPENALLESLQKCLGEQAVSVEYSADEG